MRDRIKAIRDAEDFYYRDENGVLQATETAIMFGGDDQVLLNCYGIWAVVPVASVLLANEVTTEQVTAYYERCT